MSPSIMKILLGRRYTGSRRPSSAVDADPPGKVASTDDGQVLGALLDFVERVGLETVGLAVDAGCRLAVRSIDEAEDLAVLLVHPVMLVVDAVFALDADVRLVGPGDGLGLHPGDVVHVHVGRHCRSPWIAHRRLADGTFHSATGAPIRAVGRLVRGLALRNTRLGGSMSTSTSVMTRGSGRSRSLRL